MLTFITSLKVHSIANRHCFWSIMQNMETAGHKSPVFCPSSQFQIRSPPPEKKAQDIKNKNNPEIQSLLRSMLCHLASTHQLFEEILCHQNSEKYSSVEKASHARPAVPNLFDSRSPFQNQFLWRSPLGLPYGLQVNGVQEQCYRGGRGDRQ